MNLEERMAFHYRGGEHDYSNQHPFLREHQLYATDGFGCLEINPAAGRVGEYLTLTLTSRVGAKGIRPGNLLKLFIVGFNPFSMFTTDAAQTGLALVLALARRQ